MKTIEITQSEILMATRPNVFRNRKKYNRHVSIQKFAVLNAKGWMFEDLFKYFSYL